MQKKVLSTIIAFVIATFISTTTINAQGCPAGVAPDVCAAIGRACTPGQAGACPAPLICNQDPNQGVGNGRCQAQSGGGTVTQQYQRYVNSLDAYLNQENNGVKDLMVKGFGDSFAADGGTQRVMGLMANLYQQPPSSTGQYIAYKMENLNGPVSNAYAQGGGFSIQAFSPVIRLWEFSRNIALIGFVVILGAIGFMVMLRSRLDPRTVVTIQMAIPKIAIALILVLFSYAITGLIVDVVNVGTRAIIQVLQDQQFIAYPGSNNSVAKSNQLRILMNANIFQLFQQLYNVDDLIIAIGDLSEFNIVASVLQLDQFLSGGGITRLVLWIAMFVAVIRTFFMLLTTYLKVTLYVIFSPFQFLMMAIPGQGNFGGWLRNFLSQVLVFPVTFLMLALAAIFLAKPGNIVWYDNPGATTTGVGNVWRVGPAPGGNPNESQVFMGQSSPNYQPYWSPVGLGNWGDTVGPLLTLAILLTLPKTADLVKETINPKGGRSSSDGEAAKSLQSAAARIPMLGSFTKG